MKIKEGVDIRGIQSELVLGLHIIDSVYLRVAKKEVTITSIMEGVHMPDSLHKKGLAADCRTSDIFVNLNWLIAEMSGALGKQFQVILEKDHIHFEFDPK